MGPRWNLTNRFGALFMSPNENKPIHKICKHEHWKNLQHILKVHRRQTYNINFFKCLRKKILHSNFNFHFGLVNISSKHFSITLQNSQRWEITQHTIDVENQQFFQSKSWWMYTRTCWTTFDHCYGPWKHI